KSKVYYNLKKGALSEMGLENDLIDKNSHIATEQDKPSASSSLSRFDVFLSYSSAYTNLVENVRTMLQNAGLTSFMAKYDMEGEVWESMGVGIERARVVLIFYSHSYKKSPYCRHEALYALKRRKLIIPLKVQQNYDPDGWLGIAVVRDL